MFNLASKGTGQGGQTSSSGMLNTIHNMPQTYDVSFNTEQDKLDSLSQKHSEELGVVKLASQR